jgi:predicted ATPase
MLHQFRREGHAAQERAEATIALSNEQGFPFYLVWGTIPRGWVLAEQGQGEEGIAQIREGLAAYRAMGAEVYRPYFLALLAEAYGKVGQTEEGLTVLTEALEAVDRTGERYYEAELYRLKGKLVLQSGVRGPGSEVEECFLKAIEISRRQQAKSLELRAATSLGRLWQHQGKKAEAHELVSEIYHWFTEGFDTKDLQDAKTLLEELA